MCLLTSNIRTEYLGTATHSAFLCLQTEKKNQTKKQKQTKNLSKQNKKKSNQPKQRKPTSKQNGRK